MRRDYKFCIHWPTHFFFNFSDITFHYLKVVLKSTICRHLHTQYWWRCESPFLHSFKLWRYINHKAGVHTNKGEKNLKNATHKQWNVCIRDQVWLCYVFTAFDIPVQSTNIQWNVKPVRKKLVRSSNLLTKINWDIKASDSSHICVKNSENLIKIHIKIVSDLSINVLGGKASDLDQIFGKEQKIFTFVDHYFFAWNYKSNECLTCLLQTNMKPVYFRPISDLAGHQLDFHRSNGSFMKKESQLTSSACGSL